MIEEPQGPALVPDRGGSALVGEIKGKWCGRRGPRPGAILFTYPEIETFRLVRAEHVVHKSLVRLSQPTRRLTVASTVGIKPIDLYRCAFLMSFRCASVSSDYQSANRSTAPAAKQAAVHFFQVMQIAHRPGKTVEQIELASWQVEKTAQLSFLSVRQGYGSRIGHHRIVAVVQRRQEVSHLPGDVVGDGHRCRAVVTVDVIVRWITGVGKEA